MDIVRPSFEIMDKRPKEDIYRLLERIIRVCYKSEDKITPTSHLGFIQNIVKRRHFAMLEHEKVSVLWTVDRGVSHEMVRHRLAAYAQESTRYCNYGKANSISVLKPDEIKVETRAYELWEGSCQEAEKAYLGLLAEGASPQIARSVLPTCLKTEIVSTFNLREWRWFFTMRADPVAHPLMRQVAEMALASFQEWMPEIFLGVRPYSTLDY